eukprot:gene34351-41581_t
MVQRIDVSIEDFQITPIPDELRLVAKNGIVSLLSRKLTDDIFKMIINAWSLRTSFYITGPSGIGKSSILFMTAAAVLRHNAEWSQRSKQVNQSSAGKTSDEQASKRLRTDSSGTLSLPIFLLYLANSDTLVGLRPEEVAGYLLHMIVGLNEPFIAQNAELQELLNPDGNSSQLDLWNNLCSALVAMKDVRCLILIDQWNALIEASLSDPHPLHRFSTFSAAMGAKSMLVAAVSSSFSPLDVEEGGVSRDATAIRFKHEVQPLTLDELKALRDIWAGRDEVVVDDTTLDLLHQATGGIPRLCEMFVDELRSNPGVTVDHPSWRRKCTDYYVALIKSVDRRISNPAVRQSFKAGLASLLLLNYELPNVDSKSASRWESSGLLIRESSGQFLVPANPFVRAAIDAFIFS